MSTELRLLLGTVATRGWRNYLTWGAVTFLHGLGGVFLWRFAMGTITPADFIALLGVVGPLLYQMWARTTEIRAGVANRPSDGLVNNGSLA